MRGWELGEGFAFEVDDGGAAGIGDAGAVGALAVAANDIGEVLDGASLEEGGPSLMAGARPVGTDEEDVVAELGGVAEPKGEAEVVADGGADMPATPLDNDTPCAASDLGGFAAHAESVSFVVEVERAVGSDEVHAVEDPVVVAHGPGGDKEGVVTASHLESEIEGRAKRRLGLTSHVVAEAGAEGFRENEDVGLPYPIEGLLDNGVVGEWVFPGDVLLKEGDIEMVFHEIIGNCRRNPSACVELEGVDGWLPGRPT